MSAVQLPNAVGATPVLRTLALCDLVDSTGLVERLGDQRAATLMRRHDRLWRDLLHRHGGQEIDRTDGFLAMFERPIRAVAFALAYQAELKRIGEIERIALRARIGVHIGDVIVWDNSPADVVQGAKPVEIEGLVKPVTARLASLAQPGQILVSGLAAPLAQRAHGELDGAAERTRWVNHGRYRFKGVQEAVAVYEVGEPGIAPLRAPPWSGKAYREVPWWRRPATVAVEALLLGSVVLGSLYAVLRPPAAIAFAERDWVVVGETRNLTGQDVFNDSLSTALRVSLEQSHYVNLLSDMQIRDSITRMRRDAKSTPVDREIGAEVAIREGARALILPTVMDSHGQFRVTLEIVDPNTQATVYSVSADSNAGQGVLPAVDSASKSLRLRLGEALASVSANSPALGKVTTANLDALRAYALGNRAYADRRWPDALALFDHATKLDADFAMAYTGKARVHLGSDDRSAALADLQQAQQRRERLPPREALYLDALVASYRAPADMLNKWQLMGTVYPDAYFAFMNYGLFAWQFTGTHRRAIEEVKKALSPHNAFLGHAHYLMGTLYLADDDLQRAKVHLDQAVALKGQGLGLVIAEAHATQREFELARKTLDDSTPSGMPSNDIFRWRTELALAFDRGEWDQGMAAASKAIHQAELTGTLYKRIFQGTQLSVSQYSEPRADYSRRLAEYVRDGQALLENKGDPDRNFVLFSVLAGSYLAARNGDLNVAVSGTDAVRDEAVSGTFPIIANMLQIADLEIARRRGAPGEAIRALVANLNGSELYLSHVALRDAYVATASHTEALAEAEWLISHRGRAYAEYNAMQMLKSLNVSEANLSILSAAESLEKLHRNDEASRRLAEFRANWPQADHMSFLVERLSTLSRQL